MFPKYIFTNLKRNRHAFHQYLHSSSSTLQLTEPVVTILNASSKTGRNLALLLKQSPFVGELRLYDKGSTVCAIAEDLSYIDTKAQIKRFAGIDVLNQAIAKADIVISIGGNKSSLTETPKDLFEKNVNDVRVATMHMIESNPKGIFCIARPPVEALLPLVSEEFKKAGVYDPKKLFGITTVCSMRANSIIAKLTKSKPLDVLCPVVGGVDGECLVGVLSQTIPKGLKLQNGEVQRLIACAEDDVLGNNNNPHPICLASALGISRFVNTLLRAIKGDTNCVECSFVRQTGHLGMFLPYMTTIVRLGRHGVQSTHMPKISGEEGQRIQKVAVMIKDMIKLGESVATGDSQTTKEPRKTNEYKTYSRTKNS